MLPAAHLVCVAPTGLPVPRTLQLPILRTTLPLHQGTTT
uniref:Uncharacterized protein n=1 Tax=Arundo donax TaxID=35708 RepID=A0A0A9BKX5_ARUDO